MKNNLFEAGSMFDEPTPIGDPDGEPFRVAFHLDHYAYMDIVVFASDEIDARNRIYKALSNIRSYVITRGDPYNKLDRIDRTLIGTWEVTPFDKRYCSRFPWAANDRII